jgi:phospholipid transport system transporter-binding protein
MSALVRRESDCLRVTAPMTLVHARALLTHGQELLAADVAWIDLAEVREADSSALAVLLSWQRLVRSRGGRLALCGAPEGLRSLCALYGLAPLLALD